MKNNMYKEKLKLIKENPGMIFGLLYPYLFVIILGIGLYYLGNIGNVAQQKVTPKISEPTVVSDLSFKEPQSIPPLDVNKISEPTKELIEKGKEIYTTTCAACHGVEGTGTGPGSVGLNPAPLNLTKSEGWTNGETVSGIYITLQEGIPNSAMIAYDYLTPEQKFGLAHYIRSEFISNPQLDDESDLMALDLFYNLSTGTELPGQIPTESAMLIVSEDNNLKIEKIHSAIVKIEEDLNNSPVVLLKAVTSDLQLALSALSNTNSWRANEDSFIKFLTMNVNQNGFNGKIFNLRSDEWNLLYNYLRNLL